MKNLKKGFTLIELLVVVAIIGILASVVLASLNTARTKGKDASAQASISSMRAQAELGVTASGVYVDSVCYSSATGGLKTLLEAVLSVGATNIACAQQGTSASTGWAVEALLPTGGTNYFCVDSTGFAGPKTASSITATNKITASPVTVGQVNVSAADYTCE